MKRISNRIKRNSVHVTFDEDSFHAFENNYSSSSGEEYSDQDLLDKAHDLNNVGIIVENISASDSSDESDISQFNTKDNIPEVKNLDNQPSTSNQVPTI